jgi:Raf kinase inhibitor-like YbhB/YbcL family protein
MALKLESPAFDDGGKIPDKFAKDGRNVSPPLIWSGAPPGTRAFVLIVEDPDAPNGTFRHWAVYDIPGDWQGIDEGKDLSGFGLGVNDFGNRGYDGPQPPPGHGTHHYHFRLAAIGEDHLSGIADDASVATVWDKAQPHLIEQTELVGTYEVKEMAQQD